MEKITLENLYTPYTLDTYGTFSMNEVEEMSVFELSGEYDDYEWTYDKKGYLEALSRNLLSLLKNNILDSVIVEVESDLKISSPRAYNFDTDKIWLDFTVNIVKLNEYIEAHKEDYDKNKLQDRSGFLWYGDEHQTKLNYYLMNKTIENYTPEDYFDDQARLDVYDYISFE